MLQGAQQQVEGLGQPMLVVVVVAITIADTHAQDPSAQAHPVHQICLLAELQR